MAAPVPNTDNNKNIDFENYIMSLGTKRYDSLPNIFDIMGNDTYDNIENTNNMVGGGLLSWILGGKASKVSGKVEGSSVYKSGASFVSGLGIFFDTLLEELVKEDGDEGEAGELGTCGRSGCENTLDTRSPIDKVECDKCGTEYCSMDCKNSDAIEHNKKCNMLLASKKAQQKISTGLKSASHLLTDAVCGGGEDGQKIKPCDIIKKIPNVVDTVVKTLSKSNKIAMSAAKKANDERQRHRQTLDDNDDGDDDDDTGGGDGDDRSNSKNTITDMLLNKMKGFTSMIPECKSCKKLLNIGTDCKCDYEKWQKCTDSGGKPTKPDKNSLCNIPLIDQLATLAQKLKTLGTMANDSMFGSGKGGGEGDGEGDSDGSQVGSRRNIYENYKKIQDPLTQETHNINSERGQQILNQYMTQYNAFILKTILE